MNDKQMMVEVIVSRQRSVDKPDLIKYIAADKIAIKQIVFTYALAESGYLTLIRDKLITSRTGAAEGFRLYKITSKGYLLIQEIINGGLMLEKHFNRLNASQA